LFTRCDLIPDAKRRRRSHPDSYGHGTQVTALHNVRDQRRRALGAPLADRSLSAPVPVPASGVPTRDDRCIA